MRLADVALVDQLLDPRPDRQVAELVVDHRRHPDLLGHLDHVARFGQARAIGFSQSTCLPASSAAITIGWWRYGGRGDDDRVDLRVARTSRHSVVAVGIP